MSDSSDNSDDNIPVPDNRQGSGVKRKQKIRLKQKYRTDWEQQFKWLKPDKGSLSKCYCSACNASLSTDIGVLRKHEQGLRHIENAKKNLTKQATVKELFSSVSTHDNALKFEIWLASYFAEHNIAFNAMDHLVSGLKMHIKDPVIQAIKLGRTKATAITKNVIGKCHQEDIFEDMKNVKFSILIDESTDRGTIKSMCVCVRYVTTSGAVTTKLLSLIQVFDKNDFDAANKGATASHLYDCVTKLIDEAKIPHENLIGFASDSCNTMMGSNNSVASRLRAEFPGIIILKCICHSLHLCASKACESLPRMCENLARDVYSFFKNSSKRQCQFSEFQSFCNAEPHKILRPAQTRWLSLNSVVNRLLEQWEALKLFFNSQWLEHKVHASEHISIALNNNTVKLYYLFLQWVLPKVTRLNEYFQTEKVIISDLHLNICRMYKDLLSSFIPNEHINKMEISKIDPMDASKYIYLRNIYLGVGVMKQLNVTHLTSEELDGFYTNCQKILKTVCVEIKKRYNFDDPILSKIAIYNPNAVQLPQSIFDLTELLPRLMHNLDVQDVDTEWRMYYREKNNLPVDVKDTKDVDLYWYKIGQLSDYDTNQIYKSISIFALRVLSLPHSNAECERVFSKVNLIKTDIRNRLNTGTISNLILASQHVKSKGGCNKFIATKKMMSCMNKENLYSNLSKQEVQMLNEDVEIEEIVF